MGCVADRPSCGSDKNRQGWIEGKAGVDCGTDSDGVLDRG